MSNQLVDPMCLKKKKGKKSHHCCPEVPRKEDDCWVISGPQSTVLFQGFQNVYFLPAFVQQIQSSGKCLSLITNDELQAVEGVRIQRDGLYNISIAALLETFTQNDPTTRSAIVALEDVRLFIDDVKSAWPVSLYGQTSQFAAPLFGTNNGQVAAQSPSLGYDTNLFLRKGQQVTLGFLFTSPQLQNWFRLTIEWSVVRIAEQGRTGCGRIKSNRVEPVPQ